MVVSQRNSPRIDNSTTNQQGRTLPRKLESRVNTIGYAQTSKMNREGKKSISSSDIAHPKKLDKKMELMAC